MGCVKSKYDNPYVHFPLIQPFRETFETIQLSRSNVGALYKQFQDIDVDGSGSLDIVEMLVALHIEKTDFTRRIFGVFDKDRSGKIDFEEFVLGMWNFCTLQKTSFELFAFDLYDSDKSGIIDISEAQNLIEDIFGSDFAHNAHARRAHQKLVDLNMVSIDTRQFQNFVKSHNAILYPAFVLQSKLRKYIMGPDFWEEQAHKRNIMSDGRYVCLTEILRQEKVYDLNSGEQYIHTMSTEVAQAAERARGASNASASSVTNASVERVPRRKLSNASNTSSSVVSNNNRGRSGSVTSSSVVSNNRGRSGSATSTSVTSNRRGRSPVERLNSKQVHPEAKDKLELQDFDDFDLGVLKQREYNNSKNGRGSAEKARKYNKAVSLDEFHKGTNSQNPSYYKSTSVGYNPAPEERKKHGRRSSFEPPSVIAAKKKASHSKQGETSGDNGAHRPKQLRHSFDAPMKVGAGRRRADSGGG